MFDLEDEEFDLDSLPSWGLPGYTQSMGKSVPTKAAAGKTAKRATTKMKGSKKAK